MYRRNSIFLGLFIALSSCSTFYQPTSLNHTQYKIDSSIRKDSSLVVMLQPYSTNINATMNKVIGTSADTYNNKRPESEIGNFLADCYKAMAEKKFERKIDAAFMNVGGIRSYMSKGNITVGKIFEIMPFDNLLVLQELKGGVLQQYLDVIAADGGWPVSKGVTIQIKNKKAVNVMINGKPLDVNATYTVAHSDYIANGGSDCSMLKSVPQINKGYLMRDAILEYVSMQSAAGKTIQPIIENRVTNAD